MMKLRFITSKNLIDKDYVSYIKFFHRIKFLDRIRI